MPIRIPTLQTPSVQSTPMPTPFENPDAAARGAGGAAYLASEALGDSAKLMQKAKGEADAQTALEAHNALQGFIDAGVQSVKNAEGKNAAAAAQKFYEEADKKSKEIFSGLSNEQQKLAYSNAANASLKQSKLIVESHVSEQIKAADISEFNGANANGLTRSSNNIHVPGIAEEEAGNIEKRISGETVNGVHVPGFAERRGLTADAAKALQSKLVSQVYADKAARLIDLDDVQGAEAVVKAHATELGEQGKELLGHIEAKARLIRADEWASKVANDPSFQLADGNLNTLKIEQELQKTVPAGQERLLYRAAVSHRFEQVKQGTEAKDKANWDSLLNDYHSMGRSYYDVVRNSPSWKTATGTQQEHLYQRFLADQREKRGEPPSEQQLSAFGKISYDIAARADFWGTADQRELENQADYHTLNEPLQKHLIDMVSNAHKERSSISGQIQFVDKVALQRAQTDGHPLSGTAGRRYENLDPDQQQSWDVVRDGVHARVQTWKNQNPKATYVPVQVINEAVDAETRNFVVKDGRWYVPGSTRKVTQQKMQDENLQAVAPVPFDDETKIGTDVLRRQGYSDSQMTPDMVVRAANLKRDLAGGPPPQERALIIQALRAAGSKTPEDEAAIRATYEKTKLNYVR
jgi:hypothetical protein